MYYYVTDMGELLISLSFLVYKMGLVLALAHTQGWRTSSTQAT